MATPPRRPTGSIEQAEAAFRALTTKPVPSASPKANVAPAGRDTVPLRIDRDVLAYFQEDGPGWQERINEALRRAAGL